MTPSRRSRLTPPQLRCLWGLAQHKYGWLYASGWRQRRSYEALVRRGLAKPVSARSDAYALTAAGRKIVARRWPISPFILGTYDHQPGGWTPLEGVQ